MKTNYDGEFMLYTHARAETGHQLFLFFGGRGLYGLVRSYITLNVITYRRFAAADADVWLLHRKAHIRRKGVFNTVLVNARLNHLVYEC